MSKAPKTGKTGAKSKWTTSISAPGRLDIAAPDGTVYPFFHDYVAAWRFDAQKAAPGVVFPEDARFRDIEQIEAAVWAHHKAPVPMQKVAPVQKWPSKPVAKAPPVTTADPVPETTADPVTETTADPVTETTADPVTETDALPDEPEHEDVRA